MEREARIEVRIRNNRLWKAIHSKYASVSAFCREHGLDGGEVGRLLNLKDDPKRVRGGHRKLCQTLSRIFGIVPEDLFPDHLYRLARVEGALETDTLMLSGADAEIALLPEPDDPFRNCASKEVMARIRGHVLDLPERLRYVIVRRLGLDGEEGMTFKAIGMTLGLGVERTRQIYFTGLAEVRKTLSRSLAEDEEFRDFDVIDA